MAKQETKEEAKEAWDKLVELYGSELCEDVLRELDYFYGKRTDTMRMILGRFLIRLVGTEVERLASPDVMYLWLRHAQTKRDMAEKTGRTQEYKDTWGYGLVPIIGQTEHLPYGKFCQQKVKKAEKPQK